MSNPSLTQFSELINQITIMPSADAALFLEALAPLVQKMTASGIGTNACLEYKCLPLPVHFYSPVPDMADLSNRRIWEHRSQLPGIDWNPMRQLAFLADIGRLYGHECNWPPLSDGNHRQYYTENNSFTFGCAASTHCIIRYFKPNRVIEIGSGFSSLVINEALELNGAESRTGEYTIIDPYPPSFVNPSLNHLTKLMGERVELIPPAFFNQLQANDILFIDSGHTVRIGGDVNYLILDVLPLLNPGTIIHFHDIPLPFEYPESYFTNPAFRMFWTESYLLQAFLSCNSQFAILLAMNYLMREHLAEFKNAFCHYDPARYHNESGSFWIQKSS